MKFLWNTEKFDGTPSSSKNYLEAFMEYHEAFMEHQAAFMEYQEALWNINKLLWIMEYQEALSPPPVAKPWWSKGPSGTTALHKIQFDPPKKPLRDDVPTQNKV